MIEEHEQTRVRVSQQNEAKEKNFVRCMKLLILSPFWRYLVIRNRSKQFTDIFRVLVINDILFFYFIKSIRYISI